MSFYPKSFSCGFSVKVTSLPLEKLSSVTEALPTSSPQQSTFLTLKKEKGIFFKIKIFQDIFKNFEAKPRNKRPMVYGKGYNIVFFYYLI